MSQPFKTPFARRFTSASSQSLDVDTPVVTAAPFTMACWFNATAASGAQTLMWLGDKDASDQYFQLALNISTVGRISMQSRAGGSLPIAEPTTSYVANRWHHACGIAAAANDRRAFLDGGSKATETTSSTPAGADRTSVGRLARSAPTFYFDGYLVFPTIWNIALADCDVDAMAKGAHPLTIRPEAIVAFWDWTGANTEFGLRGTYPLVNNGSTPVNGPAFLSRPIGRRRRFNSVGGGGGGMLRRPVGMYGHMDGGAVGLSGGLT
jgi:hypothetical protein